MATTYGTSSASSASYDMSLWYDSKYYKLGMLDRKSTRLNSSHSDRSRMPSSA